MPKKPQIAKTSQIPSQIQEAQVLPTKGYDMHDMHPDMHPPETIDPRVETLVNELIGRVADKWTMLILEVLVEKGELRFTRISEQVAGISQKMLTQTLRHMERDGLITRTVHPVVPPKVEYRLTALGGTLGAAFCGVWIWAEQNLEDVETARAEFDKRSKRSAA